MKHAILVATLAILTTTSYAKASDESVGICAGHYFMTKQYDKVQPIINKASNVAKMRQATEAWIDVILKDGENGTDVASEQARKACVDDLKIKSFPY